MNTSVTSCFVVAVGGVYFAIAPLATSWAQNAPSGSNAEQRDTSGALEEIVVTAQRRAESLQDVPIAVTALTSETIAKIGITGIEDLPIAVPGLHIESTIGQLTTHLRGVGSIQSGAGQENPVALYVDGVYYANQTVGIFSFNNISQIAVLKGPQGTLFGRNSTGGLIQIETEEPTQNFQMRADVGASNYRGVDGDLYISGGLATNLAADIAIRGSRRGGYGTNLFNGQEVYAEPFDVALRTKWVYTPENWKITLIGDYSNTDNSNQAIAAPPGTFIARPTSPAPNFQNAWDNDNNIQPSLKNVGMGGSLKVQRDFDFATLSNLAAGRQSVSQNALDNDGTALQVQDIFIEQRDYQISDELQLTSRRDGPLKWVTGLYYFYEQGRYNPLVVDFGTTPELNPAFPLGHILVHSQQDSASIAGYAQASYQVTDKFQATVGIRYSHEHRILDARDDGIFLFPGNPTLPLIPSFEKNESFGDPTYRLALDYKISDDLLVYASFNTGFKSGGYNANNPTDPQYLPEKLKAYEIGEKLETSDRKLRFNSALFYYDYADIQVEKPETNGSGIINGAKATIYGFDGDIAVIPIAPLQLAAGVSLLHSKFNSFPLAQISSPATGIPTTVGDVSGNSLPYAPKAVIDMSATYSLTRSLSLTAIYYHSTNFFFEPDNVAMQPAFNRVNASLRWDSADDRFWVRLYGDNLGNAVIRNVMLTQPSGFQLQLLEPPRTYGVKLGVKF